VRDVFDMSASANSMAPLVSILLPLQLNETTMLPQSLSSLLWSLSEVSEELDLSASNNSKAALVLIVVPVLSENDNEATSMLQRRVSEVRDMFTLSASANLIAPSSPTSFSVE
jgi:hypothetical protein